MENSDKDVEVNDIPIDEDGLVEYIVNEHILSSAGYWTNKRIENYLFSQGAI